MDNSDNKERDPRDADDGMPKPPDGGWGWIVVFASFMTCVIVDGIFYGFGVFYKEFLRDFKESRSFTSCISSTMVGATLGFGPVASELTKKFGCRATTIMGSLCATFGLVTSTVVPNVTWLIFTSGICTGAGFGLIYLARVVCISYYFEKRRSFATGIAMSGTGIGILLLSTFIQWMINLMGWRSAMLIVAGLVLNCSVLGSLFRPLRKQRKKQKPTEPDVNLTDFDVACHIPQKDSCPSKSLQYDTTAATDEVVLSPKVFADFETPSKPTVSSNVSDVQEYCVCKRSTSEFSVESTFTKQKFTPRQKSLHHPECSQNRLWLQPVNGTCHNNSNDEHKIDSSNKRSLLCFLCRHVNPKRKCCSTEIFDLRLLKNAAFLIICISSFLMSFGFDVPYIYFEDRIIELHIANDIDASYLLSVSGISNTVGRVVSGFLSDRRWVNRFWMFCANILVCGLFTALCFLFTNYSLMAFYAVVFGYTTGAYVGMRSVILIDIVGLDNISGAFGIQLLFEGSTCVIGAPLTGWMFDYSGSYDPGYIFCGVMITLSGILLFFIPCAQRMQQSRDQKVAKARNNSALNVSTATNISVISH